MVQIFKYIKIMIGIPLSIIVPFVFIGLLSYWTKVEEKGKMRVPLNVVIYLISFGLGYLVLVVLGIEKYI